MKTCRLTCDRCEADTDNVSIPIVSKLAREYLMDTKYEYEEVCEYCFDELSDDVKTNLNMTENGDMFIILSSENIEDLQYGDFYWDNRD